MLGVDRFLDMCRTTLNVTGDLTIATIVSRGEEHVPIAPAGEEAPPWRRRIRPDRWTGRRTPGDIPAKAGTHEHQVAELLGGIRSARRLCVSASPRDILAAFGSRGDAETRS